MQPCTFSPTTISRIAIALLGVLAFVRPVFADAPVDLLPDLVVNPTTLLDNEVVKDSETQHIYLRLSNATTNIGDGPMEVIASGWKNIDGTPKDEIDIFQRVYRSDNSFYDHAAGSFVSNPGSQYIQVEDAAQYHLRVVLPSDGVGDILATSDKTSYCLRDTRAFNTNLPGAPSSAVYDLCDGTVEGISVGYEDVYSKALTHQFIDINGIPDGTYWLEAVVDPDNKFLEKDDTNNSWRVKVTIDTSSLNSPGQMGFIEFFIDLIQQFLAFIRSLFGL